jgi:hypothetical protein
LLDQFADRCCWSTAHAFVRQLREELRAGTVGFATRAAERSSQLTAPAGQRIAAGIDDKLPGTPTPGSGSCLAQVAR